MFGIDNRFQSYWCAFWTRPDIIHSDIYIDLYPNADVFLIETRADIDVYFLINKLLFAPDLHGTIIILGNRFDEAQKTKIRNCKKLGEYFVIPKDTTKPSKRAEFLEIVKIQSSDFIGRESNDSALSLLQRSHAQDRRIPSDGIRTYKRLQDACMDRKDVPDLIAITSFNEFHENTHIEPSDSHGKQYIEATRLFSERIKFAGGKDPRRRGFTVEVKSAQLKKQS